MYDYTPIRLKLVGVTPHDKKACIRRKIELIKTFRTTWKRWSEIQKICKFHFLARLWIFSVVSLIFFLLHIGNFFHYLTEYLEKKTIPFLNRKWKLLLWFAFCTEIIATSGNFSELLPYVQISFFFHYHAQDFIN